MNSHGQKGFVRHLLKNCCLFTEIIYIKYPITQVYRLWLRLSNRGLGLSHRVSDMMKWRMVGVNHPIQHFRLLLYSHTPSHGCDPTKHKVTKKTQKISHDFFLSVFGASLWAEVYFHTYVSFHSDFLPLSSFYCVYKTNFNRFHNSRLYTACKLTWINITSVLIQQLNWYSVCFAHSDNVEPIVDMIKISSLRYVYYSFLKFFQWYFMHPVS